MGWLVGGLVVVAAASVVLAGWIPGAADALACRASLPVPGGWSCVVAVRGHRWWPLAPAVAAALWWRFAAVPLEAVVIMVVGAVVWLDCAVDVRCRRLPDAVAAPLWAITWAVIAVYSLGGDQSWRLRSVVLASLAAAVVLAVVWLVGMGFGDVKFGAIVAGVVGWQAPSPLVALHRGLAMVLVAAVGAVVWAALHRLVGSRRHAGQRPAGATGSWFAFGPFLAVGAGVTVMVGGPLVAAVTPL